MTRFLSNTLIFTLLLLAGCSYSGGEYEYRQTITADVSNVDKITGCEWKQISGPNTALIMHPNKPTTEVTGLIIGFYDFEFSVTNEHGTGKDTVRVTVLGPTLPLHLKKFSGKTSEKHNKIKWVYESDEPATYRLTRNGREIYSTFLPEFEYLDYSYETISKYQLIATTAAGRIYYSEVLQLVNKSQTNSLRFANGELIAYLQYGGKFKIAVYTAAGQMIYGQQGNAVSGVNRWTLPVSGWASGVYIATVQTDNNLMTVKFKR